MKKILAFALALMLALPAMALADGNSADITVQGTGEVTGSADMVTVTANASVTGKNVTEAQTGMNQIIESVIQKLLELSVNPDDIVTMNYNYYPTYDYNSEMPTVSGYQASHTLSITCRDVDMLDSVIGVLTDCGMSEIYNVEYGVSNRSELYQQALELAIDAAAKKANVMAQAAGLTIDHLESVTENGSYDDYNVVNMSYDGVMGMKAESSGTGIRSGGVSVTASVTAVYETREK